MFPFETTSPDGLESKTDEWQKMLFAGWVLEHVWSLIKTDLDPPEDRNLLPRSLLIVPFRRGQCDPFLQ